VAPCRFRSWLDPVSAQLRSIQCNAVLQCRCRITQYPSTTWTPTVDLLARAWRHDQTCAVRNERTTKEQTSFKKKTHASGSDSTYRQDMFLSSPWRLGSAVSSIDSLSYIGTWRGAVSSSWHSDPFLDRGHDLYKTARALAHVRQSCRPLREGTTAWRMAESSNGGLMAFSRLVVGAEILVIVNTDSGFNSRTMTALGLDNGVNGAAGQVYRNLFDMDQSGVTGYSATGEMLLNFAGGSFSLSSDSFAIFVHENNIDNYNTDLGVSLCKSF